MCTQTFTIIDLEEVKSVFTSPFCQLEVSEGVAGIVS